MHSYVMIIKRIKPRRLHMKRFCKVGIACLSTLIILTGCSTNTHGLDPKKPIAITVWHYYNSTQKKVFDQLVASFNDTAGKEKGIIVEATSMGSIADLADAVNKSANKDVGAKELPNMFATYADTALTIDKTGSLANLDTYITKQEKEKYMDSYIEEGILNGEFKVFPIAKACETLMVNKTDWTAFANATGVTTDQMSTWEGLVSVAEKYYVYSNGKAFFGRDAFANYMLVGSKQLNHPLFTLEDGNVKIDIDEATMRKLWDNYYVPYVKGYFYSHGRFATDDMKTNDIIALVGSTSGTAFFPSEVSIKDDNVYPIEYEVLPLPNFANSDPYSVQQGAGMSVTTSDEAHEYASVEFLKWFTQKERNLTFSAQSAYLPVLKEANDPELLPKALEEADAKVSQVVEDVLVATLKQNQTYELYTSPNFNNSYNARSLLEKSMKEKAKTDKAAVDQAIASGTSREEALTTFLNDTNFRTWYEEFSSSLQQVMTTSGK